MTEIYDKCPICERKFEKENMFACYCTSCKIWWDKDVLSYEEWNEPKEQATCFKCGEPVNAYKISMVLCYWKDDYSGRPVCKGCKNDLILKGISPKRFINPIDRHKYDKNGRKKRKLIGVEKWL